MKRKVFIILVYLFALTACDTDSKEGITEESSLNVELEERDNVIEKQIELIVSNYGGTGHYTYSRFYKIDEEGILKELQTNFIEGDSQPDILEQDQMTFYSSSSTEEIRDYYIVYDQIKEAPDSYAYRVSSLYISDNMVLETPLAIQRIVYEGEDFSANITSKDSNGNTLTEEEYDNYAESYYNNMGLTKNTATFGWAEVNSLVGMSDTDAAEVLMESYQKFSRK